MIHILLYISTAIVFLALDVVMLKKVKGVRMWKINLSSNARRFIRAQLWDH